MIALLFDEKAMVAVSIHLYPEVFLHSNRYIDISPRLKRAFQCYFRRASRNGKRKQKTCDELRAHISLEAVFAGFKLSLYSQRQFAPIRLKPYSLFLENSIVIVHGPFRQFAPPDKFEFISRRQCERY